MRDWLEMTGFGASRARSGVRGALVALIACAGCATLAAPSQAAIFPSSTSLGTFPGSSVTNEGVTLFATVTASSAASQPAGTVTFENGGTAIGGCSNIQASSTSSSASSNSTAFACPTSFAAVTSPERLTAVFTPSDPSDPSAPGGSSSPVDSFDVGLDETSISLDVSNPALQAGQQAIFTAAVVPAHGGASKPVGVVDFLDAGKPIPACQNVPVGKGGPGTAICGVTYRTSGPHQIQAIYSGDLNFAGSRSSLLPVSVHPLPPRVIGALSSVMDWSFYYTPSYTRVLALMLTKAPVGATVLVLCHGGGCPFAQTSAPILPGSCKNNAHSCAARHTVRLDLGRRFRNRRLRAGAQITIELIRANWIGKHYLFTVRSGHPPRIWIACLAPGRSTPGKGC